MEKELFGWLLNIVKTFADIGSWLTTPLWDKITPLMIIGGSGLIIVASIWLVKFLNPLG